MATGKTRIKICGIRDSATARGVAESGADYLGLVFVEKSPRFVTPEQAGQVLVGLPGNVQAVGLFADRPPEEVRRIARLLRLRLVQLHGNETPDDVRALAPLGVLKAMAFEASSMTPRLQPWRQGIGPENVQGILLDAPRGGSGQAFDWQAMARWKQQDGWRNLPPLFLAGGLTPQNVGTAIRLIRPFAVDVSSGVESARGVKDPQKIRAFCAAVRAAEA